MTDQNSRIATRATLVALLLFLLVFAAATAFQIRTSVFQPPLVAYWFLVFAAFLPPVLIGLVLVPLLFVGHVLTLFATRYVEQHGLPVGHSFVAILQTEGGEALAYLNQSISGSDWVAAGILAVVLGALMLAMRQQMRRVLHATRGLRPAYAFAYLATLSIAVYLLSGLHGQATLAYQSVQHTAAAFGDELARQQALRDEFGNIGWRGAPLAADFDGTTVLVIGESTSRHHLQLYGYPRETTPFLNSIADRLLHQRDTISAHSYTIQSLTEALSSANRDDGRKFSDAPSENILSAAKAAGIKTYWFSNQNKYGIWDNLVSLLGQTADVSAFTRKSFGKLYHFRSFDHELIPLLDEALADDSPRKLIVLHLYATHFPYCDFVPEDQRHFQLQAELGRKFFGNARDMSRAVNCYDDGVRYVDEILRQVIARADASAAPVLVSYLSDHGEDPAGGTAHEIPMHRGPHIEIPFIVYANDRARARLQPELDAFAANADRPFKSSDFYHTLLDLLVEPSPAVRHDRSLFSPDYTPYERSSIRNDEGPEFVLYDRFDGDDNKDYSEKARANLTALRRTDAQAWRRVWAHRVNTLGKLLEAKQLFSGVEVDLVYSAEDDAFHIHHPPAPSTGLTLEAYLAAARDKPRLGLWLDWKNASSTDVEAALARLDDLDRHFDLRNRSILEFPIDTPLTEAKVIRGFDWQTSYYLPTSQILECGSDDSADCLSLVDKILQRTEGFDVDLVSFDYRARDFMRHHAAAFSAYRQITWDLEKNVTKHDLQHAQIDEHIDVLLVTLPSLFHY